MSVLTTKLEKVIAKMAMANRADYYTQFRGLFGAGKLGLDMAATGNGPVAAPLVEKYLSQDLYGTPKVAVINDASVTSRTSRAALPLSTTEGTTAYVNITRQVAEVDMQITPASYQGNAVDIEAMLTRKISEAGRKLLNTIDAAAITALDAARTQVGASTFELTFDATGDRYTLTVPAGATLTQKYELGEQLLGAAKNPFLSAGIPADQMWMVASTNVDSVYNYMKKYGPNNEKDLQQLIQSAGYPYLSTNIDQRTETPKDIFNLYGVLPYSFGIYTGVEWAAMQGLEATEGKKYTMYLPEIGLDVAIFEQNSIVDNSGTTNNARENVTRYVMTVDFATMTAYQPDIATVHTPVAKFSAIDNA